MFSLKLQTGQTTAIELESVRAGKDGREEGRCYLIVLPVKLVKKSFLCVCVVVLRLFHGITCPAMTVSQQSFYGRLIGSVVGHLAMACLILHRPNPVTDWS